MALLDIEIISDFLTKVICTDRSKKVQNIVKYIELKESLYLIEQQLNITSLRDHDIVFLRDLVFQYIDCINDERREELEIQICRMLQK